MKKIVFFYFLSFLTVYFFFIPKMSGQIIEKAHRASFYKAVDSFYSTLGANQKVNKSPFNAGDYRQILNANKTIINPGDSIQIRHYFTGYGLIDHKTTKLYFTPSTEIIDSTKSKLIHGFNGKGELWEWGGHEIFINNGVWIHLNHTTTTSYGALTYFSDMMPMRHVEDSINHYLNTKDLVTDKELKNLVPLKNTNFIASEGSGKDGQPPLLWKLKIKDDIPPGSYKFNFYFTYFNGIKWNVDEKTIEIIVMSWFERNEKLLAILAFIVSITSVVSFFQSIISIPKKYRITRLVKNLKKYIKKEIEKSKAKD